MGKLYLKIDKNNYNNPCIRLVIFLIYLYIFDFLYFNCLYDFIINQFINLDNCIIPLKNRKKNYLINSFNQ